jgi:magnesium-transporting ATPase (P-type)
VSFLIGGLTLGIFSLMRANGLEDAAARTIAVNTLVAGQLFYLFNCRSIKSPSLGKGFFSNKYAFLAAGGLIFLQLLFVYVPFMNTFFNTSPISASYWLYPLAAGIAVFIFVEFEKWVISKVIKESQ